jgi:outer membrane protein assembly factor BamB
MDSEEESFLVALNKMTGEELWRVDREENTNWSTPVIWKNKKRTELVTSGNIARSYDPETGELFWELYLGGGRNISSPVFNKKMLYIGNENYRGEGGMFLAVKAGIDGDLTPVSGDSISPGVVWSVVNSGLSMPSPLLYKGLIYVTERRRGSITCYDALSGEAVYKNMKIPDAGPFWASPWVYNDKIYCLDERGTTHIIKSGPEFELLSQNKLDDKFWASTAILEGAYIFRGVEYIYCVKE